MSVHESEPQRATMAIVTEDGTVFEVEGLMQVECRTERDPWYCDPHMPRMVTGPPQLVVTAVIKGFEGSITLPPEMVG